MLSCSWDAFEFFCGNGEFQEKDSSIQSVSVSWLIIGVYSQIRVKLRMYVIEATEMLFIDIRSYSLILEVTVPV